MKIIVKIKEQKKHLNKVVDLLPELIKDKRWNKKLENIFGSSQKELRTKLDLYLQKREEDHIALMKTEEWGLKTFLGNIFNIINKYIKDGSIETWEDYLNYTKIRYKRSKGRRKRHLNKIIDNLSVMKTSSNWTPELERIFGNLTEEDKL